MQYDVFISYATKNILEAKRLKDELESEGLSCFLGERDIALGEDFVNRIIDALRISKVVILLASVDSLGSRWVQTELGAAWGLRKTVYPVLYRCGPENLMPPLDRISAFDFYDFNSLAKSIRHAEPLENFCVIRTLLYGEPEFQTYFKTYLKGEVTELLMLSYTGETIDQMLLGFQEMHLSINVRLLVRHWKREAYDEKIFNNTYLHRSRDWIKSNIIKLNAYELNKKPWAREGGGNINLEQKFYLDAPFNKIILLLNKDKPVAGFFGFYYYDPMMRLNNPSIYVIVGQPIILTEDETIVNLLKNQFENKWIEARTLKQAESDPEYPI